MTRIIFCRQNIVEISPDLFTNLFATQSQNASAKLALVIDEINLQALNQFTNTNPDWNQIDYGNMFKSQQVFAFHNHAFYFRMLKKTIDDMIDTGQMENLIKNSCSNSENNRDRYDGPKVLAMSDLEFGFYIWIGCCCVSIFGFVLEFLWSYFRGTDATLLAESEEGQSDGNDEDQSDEVDHEDIERFDDLEIEQNGTNEEPKPGQNQEHQSMNQNDDINNNQNRYNIKVQAEVHQADEMEESLLYFEAIIESNEKRQSLSHENDTEAISSFMDIELFGEVITS